MAAEEVLKHDATTGFNDIKAIPGFRTALHEDPQTLLFMLVGAIAALLFMIFRILRRRRKGSLAPRIPPRDIFKIEIQRIKAENASGALDIRTFSSRLSFALRRYVEGCFDFPATDLTPAEVKSRFPKNLAKKLFHLAPAANQQIIERCYRVLLSLDRVSFGTAEMRSLESSGIPELLSEAESLVIELEQAIEGIPAPQTSKPQKAKVRAHAL